MSRGEQAVELAVVLVQRRAVAPRSPHGHIRRVLTRSQLDRPPVPRQWQLDVRRGRPGEPPGRAWLAPCRSRPRSAPHPPLRPGRRSPPVARPSARAAAVASYRHHPGSDNRHPARSDRHPPGPDNRHPAGSDRFRPVPPPGHRYRPARPDKRQARSAQPNRRAPLGASHDRRPPRRSGARPGSARVRGHCGRSVRRAAAPRK